MAGRESGGCQRARRWTAAAAAILVLMAAWLIVPRVGARSPVAILVVCALAILAMKLVERRVQRWFRRWEEKTRGGAGGRPNT